MQPTTFRDALRTQSREVDLRVLSRKQKKGRVMTFKSLEGLMVEALENILLRGQSDPSIQESLQTQARDELSRLVSEYQSSNEGETAQATA